MFYTIEELVQQADRDYQGNIAELMIATETELTGRERPEILTLMTRNLEVMKESVQAGLSPEKSPTGLTGGDAVKLDAYIKNGKTLADSAVLGAARNAMAVNESNAKMGLVCATPTAGSAGCLPAVLTTAGSASAMAAAAITMAAGGTPFQASQAICFVLKNMLGLICDPVAGLVEVPCVKRNAMGASFALVAADMALAGITSAIPVDQVVDAMYQVGSAMPTAFRETAEGGLAATPKGKALAKEIFG